MFRKFNITDYEYQLYSFIYLISQRILECINQNRGTVLKCKPLAEIYEK